MINLKLLGVDLGTSLLLGMSLGHILTQKYKKSLSLQNRYGFFIIFLHKKDLIAGEKVSGIYFRCHIVKSFVRSVGKNHARLTLELVEVVDDLTAKKSAAIR